MRDKEVIKRTETNEEAIKDHKENFDNHPTVRLIDPAKNELILWNYRSIKECLLKNAINFAEQHTEITEKDKATIFHARKSLLFDGPYVWIKKEGGLFNVTMGAFNGAEVCEAVGNFLLYQLSTDYNKKYIDLYRDDGLAIFKNFSGSKVEKIKKDTQNLFKDNHLNITIQCNLKIVNYLDVTFKLSNATYQPFCKPHNEIAYIHKESNHPPSI